MIPRVLILGAGPAGLGAAYRLRRADRAEVMVVEQRKVVGGNAGSFEVAGQRVDYGSHRLHPACDPEILADIREMLGDDLLERPRHGRIRLRGRWIHFPLKPLDLLLHIDPAFALGTARDAMSRFLPGRGTRPASGSVDGRDTFASVLRGKLGDTIADDFYFPYARKIWGLDPEGLSPIQARRRVSADSFSKLARKVLGHLPGVRSAGFRHFYYPRGGYGQISEAYAEAAQRDGATVLLGGRAVKLQSPARTEDPWRLTIDRDGERRELEAPYVWSTIPITALAAIISPPPPQEVTSAVAEIRYRAMLLAYLTIAADHFSEYDAHYFPSEVTAITRLSEPKNYGASAGPRGRTVVCAELPCSTGDELWTMSDEALGELVASDLAGVGIPPPGPVEGTQVMRLAHAYPIYHLGYERPFGLLDTWAESLPGLLTYGRQGLFAHDNTHHALYMAYCAAECLTEGGFDHERWRGYRDVFETHVVED